MPSFLLGDKPLQKIKSNAIIIVVAGFIVSIVLSAVTESNKLREMLRHSRVLLFQSRPLILMWPITGHGATEWYVRGNATFDSASLSTFAAGDSRAGQN